MLKRERPPIGGVLYLLAVRLLGRRHPLRQLRVNGFSARADRDLARLGRLRHLLNQVDMEHAIVELGAGNIHVVGEAEARDLARNPGELLFRSGVPPHLHERDRPPHQGDELARCVPQFKSTGYAYPREDIELKAQTRTRWADKSMRRMRLKRRRLVPAWHWRITQKSLDRRSIVEGK